MSTRDNCTSGIGMAWPGFPGSPFILSFHGYLGPVCAPATARNAGNSLQARVSPQLMCSVTWRHVLTQPCWASVSAVPKQRIRPGAKKHFRHGQSSAGSEPAVSRLPRLRAGQEGSAQGFSIPGLHLGPLLSVPHRSWTSWLSVLYNL